MQFYRCKPGMGCPCRLAYTPPQVQFWVESSILHFLSLVPNLQIYFPTSDFSLCTPIAGFLSGKRCYRMSSGRCYKSEHLVTSYVTAVIIDLVRSTCRDERKKCETEVACVVHAGMRAENLKTWSCAHCMLGHAREHAPVPVCTQKIWNRGRVAGKIWNGGNEESGCVIVHLGKLDIKQYWQ